ncbi:Cellulase A [Carbonactinospora thermoautotrophica]|uniref:Cellulase A n=1 Tax=Carbonactinospora thermoautotrophica TaxID=1469144 RepID=A0A132MSQ7_9ACTN|nr:cellulose binding domain-containing protein [Carbonactinospora thermoautotrophica]KWX00883.1 Cellulase A [Carbonactinospora thermoautotrophica]
MLFAQFKVASEWQGGYTGTYTVINNSTNTADSWVLTFTLDGGARVADSWGAGTVRHLGGGRYEVTSNGPLQGGQAVEVTMRVEPAGDPAVHPSDCEINGNPCGDRPDIEPPSTPSGLRVTAVSPRSVTVEWDAATDNVGVKQYNVKVTGDSEPDPYPEPLPGNATSGVIGGLAADSEYQIALQAVDFAGNQSGWSEPVEARTSKPLPPAGLWGVKVAPYVDFAGWPTPHLAAYTRESGCRAWTLGFVQAAGPNDPMPSWGGYKHAYGITHNWDPQRGEYVPLEHPFEYHNITGFVQAGGVVTISFGGAVGTEISQATRSAEEAYQVYKSVLDAYPGVTRLDFDIEGAAEHDQAANQRRAAAIAKLQADYPDLLVSLTLPVNPTGLTNSGLDVLQTMLDRGARVSLVTIMAMEFGSAFPGDMGELTYQAATSTVRQIAPLFGEEPERVWARLGVCPMLGKNNNGRVFTLDHARGLVSFAREHGVGHLTCWEATRDKNACFGETYKCTPVEQDPWEFTKIFDSFMEETR